MRSSPACASRSSSLPNAFTENGQVGSRNTSNTRGPWPQTRGSARHVVCFIRSFLFARFSRTKSAGADELWGGKLRGAILSRAAHIVFLRIQVKHAHGSDLMRDPLDGNRPSPPAVQLRAPPFAHNGVARRRTLARLGDPSGDQHDQWIPHFFLRYVHAGLNLQEANDTPAWHTEHSPRSSGRARHDPVFWSPKTASLRSPSRNCADTVITSKSDPIGRRGI